MQSKQNSKFEFFREKTAFERQKSATNFRFKQTSCGIIAEPSSNNLLVKKFSDLLIFFGKYRQFPKPSQRENLNFSANGTGYDTAQHVDLPSSSI
jgi:hypothetical protein